MFRVNYEFGFNWFDFVLGFELNLKENYFRLDPFFFISLTVWWDEDEEVESEVEDLEIGNTEETSTEQ